MATFTVLDSDATTATGPYTTRSISPAADKVTVVALMASVGGTETAPAALDIAGCNLTWTQIASAPPDRRAAYLYEGRGSNPTAGTLSISSAEAVTLTGIVYAVVDAGGADTTDPEVQSFAVNTSSSTTISEAFPQPVTAGNACFAIAGLSSQTVLTPGAGWTEVYQGSYSGPQVAGLFMYADPAVQNVEASWTGASGGYVVGMEIRAAGGGAPANLDRLRIGDSLVDGIHVGDQAVSKVYVGDTQVWP